jgi:hypothetical protein
MIHKKHLRRAERGSVLSEPSVRGDENIPGHGWTCVASYSAEPITADFTCPSGLVRRQFDGMPTVEATDAVSGDGRPGAIQRLHESVSKVGEMDFSIQAQGPERRLIAVVPWWSLRFLQKRSFSTYRSTE